MTPDGLQALHANLPADLWDRVDKAYTRQIEGISFVSPQLEQKFFKKTPPEADHVHRFSSISRITLRKILLTGLEDQVTFGKNSRITSCCPKEYVATSSMVARGRTRARRL